MKSFLLILSLVALVSLSACGGGASSVVTPPPPTFTISGMVAGLPTGVTVGLADNGSDTLTVGNGPFTFAKAVSSYSVTVKTQPTGGTCSVTNGSGTATANVTNVTVTCSAAFSISGVVQGLPSGASVKLADNGTDTLTVSTNGQFTFKNLVAIGGPYSVTVVTQPTNATCTVTNGSGTATQNITSVQVSCVVSGFTISGMVSGLPTGGTVGLSDNGNDPLTVGNGPFTFAKAVSGAYNVTVVTQPAGGSCLVTNGTGTATANITNVTVTCVAAFTISGTLSGLPSGTSVVLADNGTDTKTVSANGQFTFANTVASGGAYNVTVVTQPTGTTCTVTNGSGTATQNVTSVVVTCGSGSGFTISGVVSGLPAGGTVGLADNGTDTLTTGNGPFTFAKAVSGAYSVTVATQPAGGVCTVTNGSGTATANVTNVMVTCVGAFTISGTLSGLPSGTSVVLADNGTDTKTVSANGQFTFANSVASGGAYNVTVVTQPTGTTCTVTNGSGIATQNVTSVVVTCGSGSGFTISGVVSGLPAGGTVGLADNGTDTLTTGNGPFTFAKAVSGAYLVTVATQPTGGVCTVTNGAGTATANVTNVAVTCVGGFTISGTLSGLPTGTSVVVADNLTDTLTLSANGQFTFKNLVGSGSPYSVTVVTQPAGASCTVANGSGTAQGAVTNITVTCTATSTFTIGGTVTGLPTGTSVGLSDNLNDPLTVSSNSAFTFAKAINSGGAYSVTVTSQPAGATCSVANGSGTASANVTNVAVTCSATNFTIGGSLSGLPTGSTVVLTDNTTDTLSLTANGAFTFATAVASGSPYSVAVKTQPIGATCTVTNGSGTATANVTNVTVACTAVNYTIGGTMTGLPSGSTVVLSDNTTDTLTLTVDGTFTFAKTVPSGSTYSVAVKTQPTGGTCSVSGGSGTATANVTTVSVNCAAVTFTIGGSLSGLASGTSVVVADNTTDTLTLTSNSTFTFAKALASGSAYAVTVVTQPSGQTCTVTNGSGTANANVTNVSVVCTATQAFTIGGTLSGLGTGATVVLSDNTTDTLTLTANGSFTFAKTVLAGGAYAVTVKTQPTGQTCTVTNGSGTANANVTNVTVACASTATLTLSVSVTGLTSGTLTVQDDAGKTLSFTGNKTSAFSNTYASGATYSVTITSQPSGETCTLGSNSTGTITANTTVTATCTTSSGGANISVNVTGLTSGESVNLQDDLGDKLTFTTNSTQEFTKSYTSGATYTVYVTQQPATESCTPTYSTGTINSSLTINVVCATGSTRKLGTISAVSTVSCSGAIKNGTCQQMTVACPGVPNVQAYVKTNAPTGTPVGTVTWGTGTDGNGLYDSIFTFGSTAVQNVLNGGFTTVQISWGSPFNSTQPDGWVLGPGGVLAAACRYATVTNWVYTNIHNSNKNAPMCATANSGGAGALAYALSQYGSNNVLSMAEVTSGPPTGRLDWGCGCKQGSLPVSCGSSTSLGTCFGTADGPVWDPGYNPTAPNGTGLCTTAVKGTLPPGGFNFLLGDSAEAPGATYNFPKTNVNVVFGSADNSSAIPIGLDWYNNITSKKGQACVTGGVHSLANTLAGADQISSDLISMCKLQ